MAHPKINLTLRVLGKRPDGYHALESLVAFAQDLGDLITFNPDAAPGVTCCGPFAASIAGPNLVAVTLAKVGALVPGIKLGSVSLTKNLPIAAGIGGGSADAAAVLNAIRAANPEFEATVDWHGIAARLGADVPVCLASHGQVMRGVGDELTPFANLPELHAVIVNPMVPVPADKTAQVFKRLAAAPLHGDGPGRMTPDAFATRSALLNHMAAVGNDLSLPACELVPEIGMVLLALGEAPKCELGQLSGGGPTCFGIFPNRRAAIDAAAHIEARHPAWWVKASSLA